LELGRVGFCPGSKLRMRYRKNLTGEIRLQSRHTRAKRAFITRCIPPVKPIQRATDSTSKLFNERGTRPSRSGKRIDFPAYSELPRLRSVVSREIVLPGLPAMGRRSSGQMLCEIPSRFACESSPRSPLPGIRRAPTLPPGTLENLFACTPQELIRIRVLSSLLTSGCPARHRTWHPTDPASGRRSPRPLTTGRSRPTRAANRNTRRGNRSRTHRRR